MSGDPTEGSPTDDRSNPIGRHVELAAVEHLLDVVEADRAPSGVIFVGAAGIGKTTLWRAAVAGAQGRGWVTLRAAPAQEEGGLAYAALADLLHEVGPATVNVLPEIQRQALDAARMIAEPQHAASEGMVAAAVLGVIRALAGQGPVLVAVDDVQWIDPASRAALSYVLRRCHDLPIGIVLSLRGPANLPAPLGLGRALPADRLGVHQVGPLSVGALFHVLRAELGRTFPRPTLLRLAEWSGGNPLYAVEIGRAIVASGGGLEAGTPPPLGPNLSEVLHNRIRTLSPEEQRGVLLAALAARPTVSLVAAAGAALRWTVALPTDPAIVAARDVTVEFAHPLLRAAAIAVAPSVEQRDAHRALAGLATDHQERAQHLALAATETDAQVADELNAAARNASGRGAPEVAVGLLELACRSTPTEARETLARRRTELARLLVPTGDGERARTLLGSTIEDCPPGTLRAIARMDLAILVSQSEGTARAAELCRLAADEAGDNRMVRGRAELAWSQVSSDALDSLGHAETARTLLGDGSPGHRAQALIQVAVNTSQLGRPVPWDLLDEAVALETADPPTSLGDTAAAARAWLHLMADDFQVAHAEYEGLRQMIIERGDESSLPNIAVLLAQIDLRVGRWDELAQHAREAIDVAERNDRDHDRFMGIIQLGAVAAARGDAIEATRHLDAAERYAIETDKVFMLAIVAGNRGALAFAGGDAATAAKRFDEYDRRYRSIHFGDPALGRFQGDQLEALIELGELSRATALADDIEARATPAGRRRVLAWVARGRGLLAAAAGDLDRALDASDRSYDDLAALGLRFQAARSQLVRGIIHRRRREKRLAHVDLTAALATFDELRAVAWADRAQHELGRIGLRPRAPRELTDTERTVARLAAEGHTNREIAALAFMSPRTVEGVLARAYAKLGVRSRVELGRALSDGEPLDR